MINVKYLSKKTPARTDERPTAPTVFVVMGTRPEAIKLAPVVRAMRRLKRWHVKVVATSQHREMLSQAMRPFDVEPDQDLDVMRPGQTPAQVAAAVLTGMERLLRETRPEAVIVQGDTTTALATGLAAFYCRIPVVHVEAGLRTGRMHDPFPEEANRKALATLAAISFAPTETARRNLLAEGVPASTIHVVGNTVVDSVNGILGSLPFAQIVKENNLILLTIHRRENFGRRLAAVLRCVRQLALERAGSVRIVFPVHPNPSVALPANRILSGVPGVELLPPMSYPDFLVTFAQARFALSDSGGVQEESPTVGTPVLILRDATERPEILECGWGRLVGTNPKRVLAAASDLLDDDGALKRMTAGANPFGDGKAGERIATILRTAIGAD